jgi:alkylhydroperoxidase family enzyme
MRLVGKAPRIPPVPAAGGGAATANVFNTFRHNPPADRVRGAINNHVNRNTLPTRQRELVVARIGVLCRSEYEYIAHVRSGRRAGFTDADVAMLLAGPDSNPAAAPLDLALVRATGELYAGYHVANPTWTTLAAGLDTPQLLDVLIAEGGYRSTSILINTAGVQLDANMAEFRFPPELR